MPINPDFQNCKENQENTPDLAVQLCLSSGAYRQYRVRTGLCPAFIFLITPLANKAIIVDLRRRNSCGAARPSCVALAPLFAEGPAEGTQTPRPRGSCVAPWRRASYLLPSKWFGNGAVYRGRKNAAGVAFPHSHSSS